ncbi:MAG: DUF1295 domain-containing protein [Candidatus Cloacimonetes bacterium]|nr:DUF1295 domain-containing protein [Candidatus Cloacimonadota bacterium]MCF7814652.1 DUF1295 domain-containing protein [Candidatus Cloacimonadota bacterium]MCF7869406.1 DUF1295 domain-containing protein [Candidatus Cloacimonadota bacterium]MCF7884562.1 DUF1295 domain-containing protein [Candidatus Cloacimonadota bacterium]
MKKEDKIAIAAIPIVILIALGLAWAGSQQSASFAGFPLFGMAVVLAFAINWLAFIPAFIFQSEKFYDLIGSFSYISIIILLFILSPIKDVRTVIATILVLIWAGRLGTFLVRRIRKAGKDGRFDELKPHFFRYWNAWNLQGLWVSFTSAAAWIILTSQRKVGFDIFAVIGILIWLLGFIFEVTADLQKSKFKADPANKGKFINVGLWAKSRHPNYFGEITIWLGMAVLAVPVFQSWQWIGLISPIFVAILLTRISGVPILEKRADEKWGGQTDYEEYKKNTPVLIPKL